jgi:hypothetical protein
LPIALRAFVQQTQSAENVLEPDDAKKTVKPSAYTLTFDTETLTDASQQLRFGTYQVRKAGGRGCWRKEVFEPYEKENIYDSSNQLSLPAKQRSGEWFDKVERMLYWQEGYQLPANTLNGIYGPVKPTTRELFGDIIPLGWHFYYVTL